MFSSSGSYASPQDYVNGLTPAIVVGAAVVLLGVLSALLVPNVQRARARKAAEAEAEEAPVPQLELVSAGRG